MRGGSVWDLESAAALVALTCGAKGPAGPRAPKESTASATSAAAAQQARRQRRMTRALVAPSGRAPTTFSVCGSRVKRSWERRRLSRPTSPRSGTSSLDAPSSSLATPSSSSMAFTAALNASCCLAVSRASKNSLFSTKPSVLTLSRDSSALISLMPIAAMASAASLSEESTADACSRMPPTSVAVTFEPRA